MTDYEINVWYPLAYETEGKELGECVADVYFYDSERGYMYPDIVMRLYLSQEDVDNLAKVGHYAEGEDGWFGYSEAPDWLKERIENETNN